MVRRVLITCVALAMANTAVAAQPPAVTLLQTHCYECHGVEKQESELSIQSLLSDARGLRADPIALEDMLEAVRSSDMPPRKAKRPLGEEDRQRLVKWLESELAALAAEQAGDPGFVVMPRLTPAEYRNVFRDLSGGVVTTAGEYLPAEGGAGEGFSNVGQAQGMSAAQLEKYIEAAKGAMHHLRVHPEGRLLWYPRPRIAVDDPADARKEAVDQIIAWYVAQQQKWGQEHREHMAQRLGFTHAAYFEAAWQYHHREALGDPSRTIAQVARAYQVPLAPVALEKWYAILTAKQPPSHFVPWARAWQKLPPPSSATSAQVRKACVQIELGETALVEETEDYAPPYEVSFHEAKSEVLAAAKEGRWPFRIDVGDAKELFLVVTDAGDGNRGEYALWRRGRIIFADGAARPWEEVVKVIGASSGRTFEWGVDGEGSATLTPDAIGVRPPGSLKFQVPADARIFEVELAIDTRRTKQASIQALVLKQKPRRHGYIQGRAVFGGKSRSGDAAEDNKELARALRRRNVSEANLTKVGLNAERNVLANWSYSPLDLIGGPWPDQQADEPEPLSLYHYTVEQVLQNATDEDLAQLRALENYLRLLVEPARQKLARLGRDAGWEAAREGVIPPEQVVARWTDDQRQQLAKVHQQINDAERDLAQAAAGAVADFATRVWRRPLQEGELDALMKQYHTARSRGYSFDGAVKAALLATLASPHFIYRHEMPAAGQPAPSRDDVRPLSSYELASRLSFFLWASIPDQRLLDLAAEDHLRDPSILAAEARRMLRDERARSLATDFAAQLWDFTSFEDFTNPDSERFPEFTPLLRQAMLDEVTTFIADLVEHDRPLTALIDADHTFVNAELARHYGIDGVTSSDMQRVQVPPQRGVWVHERVLGRELPNPPAGVPPLSEDDTNAAGENIREQLERHREQESCARCHDKIDPLGIALENFDGIGRWREKERDGRELAITAVTHDGITLDGVADLKTYLKSWQGDFFDHFNRKLLGYALGRAVTPGDHALLDKMRQRLQAGDHRISTLVEAIVTSRQFTHRRTLAVAGDAQRQEGSQR